MASRPANVGIRLGMDGKEEIKSGFEEIAVSGSSSAKRTADAFDRASADIEAATKRQAEAAQKLAAIGVKTGPNNNQQVLDYRAFTKEMTDQQRQAEALRDVLDPLRVAQRTYGDEIDRLRKLQTSGKISGEEYASGLRLAGQELAEAKRNLGEHSAAMGLNRTQTMIAQSAGLRFTDMLLAGQSPIRAFALESHKLAEVLAFDDGGVSGGLAKVRALLSPTVLAVAAAGVVVAGGTALWIEYANAMTKLEALSRGSGAVIGATAAGLEQQAEAAARAGNISIASARGIESGYVKLGGIGKDVLGGLASLTEDFAAATGGDAKSAQEALGKAFQDPVKGAQELTERYGVLTQSQIDNIQTLVQQGNLYGAQKQLLADLGPAFDGAAEHARGFGAAFHDIGVDISNAMTKLAAFVSGAGTAIPLAQRLSQLQQAKAQLADTFAPGLKSKIDAEIADVQGQIRRVQTQAAAAGSAARQGAQSVTEQYSGDDRDAVTKRIGSLTRGITAGGAPAQLADWTEARAANQRALDTWIPKQQKANELAEADARIAAARTPAQKAAAAADKEMINLKGEVITKSDAEARAHDAGAKALATASKSGEGHAATLARDAAAMDVNTQASLALAAAYLQGGAAALVAEARRKALTDATKKGIDVEAEVRRQLALTIAEAIATGAKGVAAVEQENTARAGVIDKVMGGTLAIDRMNDALADEAALRPLIALRAVAEGDARNALTKVIDRETAALARQREQRAQMAALSAVQAANDNAAASRDAGELAGDRTGAADVELARRASGRKADALQLAPADPGRAKMIAADVGAAEAKVAADRKKYVADALNGQRDQLVISQEELATIGMGNDARQLSLDRIKATVDLRTRGIDLESAEAKQILAGVDTQHELNLAIERTGAAMDEVRSFGASFIDDLAQGKNIAQDLYQEFIKLAALNPLKNLLNGDNKLATLGGVFGSLTKLLGGSSGISMSPISNVSSIAPSFNLSSLAGLAPGFATGTDNAPGGLAWVAENGPELINLPRGSSVTPASKTRQLLAANDSGGGATHNHFHLEGAVVTQDLLDQMNAIGSQAALQGAYGGAQLAATGASKRARYRIPGR